MRNHDRIFGLLAVLAVAVYMLACGSRPTWSPDSNRVVFSFVDRDSDTSGLALCNLQTKQTERIYETEGEVLFQPVWLDDKEQIIALAAREGRELDIIQIDLLSGESRLIKSIPAKDAEVALMVPPVLAEGRYLFFSLQAGEEDAENTLHCFDLKTGQLTAAEDSVGRYLFHFGKEYIYLGPREGEKDGLVLGKLDPKKTGFRELTVLKGEGYGEIGLGLACKKDGSEFALISMRESSREGTKKTLVVFIINRRGKVLKEIKLPADPDLSTIVHMVYGPKDQNLWVPVINPVKTEGNKPNKQGKQYILSLLEVNVDKGSCQTVLEAVVEDDGYRMQPSISPDGKYLAVNVLLTKDDKNSILYLVDLTMPERKVTKVPLLPKPEPTGASQAQ